jgi:hypothetical protein
MDPYLFDPFQQGLFKNDDDASIQVTFIFLDLGRAIEYSCDIDEDKSAPQYIP